jgi:hypothetical protein
MKLTFGKMGMLVVLTTLLAVPAQARDERLHLSLQDALETATASGKLDKNIPLYFGKQGYPKAANELGAYTTNKKTNFFGKSDKQACEWAFLSAVIALQERAKKEGGNAVVGIISVYKNAQFSSETEFECGAGSVTGGVALRGKVVKL